MNNVENKDNEHGWIWKIRGIHPCHHDMACPQFANRGTAYSMEGSCEQMEQAAAARGKGRSSRWGGGVGRGVDNSWPLKLVLLRNMNNCLGPGLIFWYDLSNEKRHEIWYVASGSGIWGY
jgi:hypothetical protein